MMQTKRIFLASSSELKDDRKEFEIFVNRKNKDWVDQGVFLAAIVWEDFLDAVSQTRLQDEYNKKIRECDVFVMLFCTKVGQYTEEEFEAAVGQFKATNKPFIFTYFKDTEMQRCQRRQEGSDEPVGVPGKAGRPGTFLYRLQEHRPTKVSFQSTKLDKLAKNGFIELKWDKGEVAAPHGNTYQATLTGNGAIAQGPGARAVGARGVNVGGKNTGNINTGTQTIGTGGGAYIGGRVDTGRGDFVGRDKITHGLSPRDLASLFGPLLAAVAKEAPADNEAAAVQRVEELKAEVAKGKQADDSKLGRIVDGLVAMVPGAIGARIPRVTATGDRLVS